LAEFQAAMLDEWAPSISPVWDRVSAVAVDDAGLWRRAGGFQLQIGTCDAARLADLSGMNVIDAFAARDLAQDGRGRPLSPIPHWLLLRDPQKTRVLVEWSKATRLTLLPPGRDAAGLARIKCHSLMPPKDSPDKDRAEAIGRWITTRFGQLPRGTELVLYSRTGPSLERAEQLTASVPDMPMHETARLGISPGSLKPAAAAVLGLLHLDQVPANIPAITLARTPRVLGRLTPGSLANWHRLVRELAAARPSVVALRSAV
jgi:1,6-anhydro-N-acetylmuramate kinase